MTIRARIAPHSEDEARLTIEWLCKSGVSQASTWQQVHDIGIVEVQLRDTPPVLAHLSQLEEAQAISRITSEGVVFYLTDIPLWMGVPEDKQRATSDRGDGFLFCPMSNVVCINTFGSVYAYQPKA
jgi:hypothetical protein